LLAFPLLAQSPPNFNRDYDPYFKAYSSMFLEDVLPDADYRWFLAQCVQESGPRLNPLAQSSAGAVGVCQLMPGTARDFGLDPEHRVLAKENIRAGALTLRRCTTLFWPRDTRYQRLQLGQACYNAGGGNVIKAQIRCGGARLWPDIAPCMSQITGKYAAETLHYVEVIPRWHRLLIQRDGG